VLDFIPDKQEPLFNRPRDPIFTINTNLSDKLILHDNNTSVNINFTEYLVKNQKGDIYYHNYTDILLREEETLASIIEEPY